MSITHEIERELRDPAPRRVRPTHSTQTTRWFLYNAAAVLLAFAWLFSVLYARQIEALRTHGKTTNATITGKHETKGKGHSYTLYYTYAAPNHFGSIASHDEVTAAQFQAEIGDPLQITYLPEDPEVNYLGAADQNGATDWRIAVSVFSAGIVTCAFFAESLLRQRLRLLRDGLPTIGVVTNRKTIPGKTTSYHVEYSYPMPSGAEKTTTVNVSQPQHDYYEPGKELTVLLNPQNTSDSLPYFLMTAVEVEGAPPRPGVG